MNKVHVFTCVSKNMHLHFLTHLHIALILEQGSHLWSAAAHSLFGVKRVLFTKERLLVLSLKKMNTGDLTLTLICICRTLPLMNYCRIKQIHPT